MSEHLHEIVKPIRDIVRGLGEFVVDKILPQGVFDDFLAGGPLDSPTPGDVGSVPTNPTLWE